MPNYGIRLEREGHLAIMTIDRPDRQNALDEHMYNTLEQAVADIKSELPRVVILTGAGNKAFCAGFDVNPENPQSSRFFQGIEQHDRRLILPVVSRIREITDGLVMLPVPVIAAINGLAYGGGAEIASRCDLRVMDPDAVICFSEVKLGLMPDHGGGVGLTRLIGPSKAADLILSARRVGAQEALALGLVNRISAPGKALDEAKSMAQTIAENGPRAVRHALKVIRQVFDLSGKEALDLETEEAATLIASGECVHGVTGFLSKRKPEFPEPE
jgi:enoyl-CoA hydratase/carnithine racemase